jgi:hypothetical protein
MMGSWVGKPPKAWAPLAERFLDVRLSGHGHGRRRIGGLLGRCRRRLGERLPRDEKAPAGVIRYRVTEPSSLP